MFGQTFVLQETEGVSQVKVYVLEGAATVEVNWILFWGLFIDRF